MFKFIVNWWRGYSDEDYQSAQEKLENTTYPGQVTYLTQREAKAIQGEVRKRYARNRKTT